MRVLLIGSGGREHALAWKLSESSQIEKLFIAPGNPGMALEPQLHCTGITANDFEKIREFCLTEKISFVVVGPDQALADGLVDFLEEAGIATFGPTKKAAELESSKAFAKDLMKAAQIPTAKYEVFTDAKKAEAFIHSAAWPSGYVVKADGLALGKGVVVCQKKEEALAAINDFLLKDKIGSSGKKIIIEERLEGPEVSAFVFCDGKNTRFLTTACDYKQLLDGGRGPNTGGMGAYSPADWLDDKDRNNILEKIAQPLLREMFNRNIPYRGMLFIGLMMTKSGPMVLEFNARFGDPETQAILPLIDGDLLPWLESCRNGSLDKMPATVPLKKEAAVHVVMASSGYPEASQIKKGNLIAISDVLISKSIHQKNKSSNGFCKVFFAGVAALPQNQSKISLETNGGRVLGITCIASTRQEARASTYKALKEIQFDKAQWRGDIGE